MADALLVKNLKCEYKENPLGIDVARPRLSWLLDAAERDLFQAAYQVRIGGSVQALSGGGPFLWDSGKVNSSVSIHVEYDGPTLHSSQRCYWQVRVWDSSGRLSPWSEPAWWEMGLLAPDDWRARWICPESDGEPSRPSPCPVLRGGFQCRDGLVTARAYASAQGLYELDLNGQRIGDHVLAPGWTSYDRRIQYQTFDITSMVRSGKNVVGATLGDGWYRGYLGFQGQRNIYGSSLALHAPIAAGL